MIGSQEDKAKERGVVAELGGATSAVVSATTERFIETLGREVEAQELMAPMNAVLEFAERLIESEDGATLLDVLMMVGEILGSWSLICDERELVERHFGGDNLRVALDGFYRRHGAVVDQVYVDWYYRARIEDRVDRNSYVFVGSNGEALEYPGEFVSALGVAEVGLGAMPHIDGVVVFGDTMSGIYG